jgi:hypothetical protein
MRSYENTLMKMSSVGRIKTRYESTAESQAARKTNQLLKVDQVKSGLHENSEGIERLPVYRISRYREPVSLFNHWRIPGTGHHRLGRFIKLSFDKINLPDEAKKGYRQASASPHINEAAVFLNTQLGNSRLQIILAGRNNRHWLELYSGTTTWQELGISRLEISSF